MEEKILERMLNNLIEEAGPIAVENMVKEDLETLDDSEIEFSKDHEEKMKKIFSDARKGRTPVISKPRKRTTFRKLAIVAAVIIALSGLTIGSVGAWRESFVSYFLNDKKEYSEVDKRKRDTELIVGDVIFGYVPDGFKYTGADSENKSVIMYFRSSDEYFELISKESKWNSMVNTESGEINDTVINEKDMVYSENNGVKFITWKENNHIYMLQGNCSKEDILKIAEEIKIK